MKSVILIGDSIRVGYQQTAREQLQNHAKVWGPEQNGGTSENILAHLDEWAISRNPDLVHINCGLHDVATEFGQDTTRVPLAAYTRNVKTILTRLQAETNATLVWATTTPVNEKRHHKNKGFDRFEADVVTYNQAAERITRELGIPVNDLFAAVRQAGRDTILLPDGVHFTAEGYVLLGQTVATRIRALLDN